MNFGDWVWAVYIILSGISAVVGGVISGMVVVYKFGKRQATAEGRLQTVEDNTARKADLEKAEARVAQIEKDAARAADLEKAETRLEATGDAIKRLTAIAEANVEARITVGQRLREVDERLNRGGESIEDVPVIAAKLEALNETLKAMQETFREELRRLVSREECNRRHEN